MSETYEIGEKEKHSLTVDFSVLTKHVKVVLDGTVVAHEWVLSPSGRNVEFYIGGSEPHHVVVMVRPFRPTEVSVDGNSIPSVP